MMEVLRQLVGGKQNAYFVDSAKKAWQHSILLFGKYIIWAALGMIMTKINSVTIHQAAEMLGRDLEDRFPDIVGVSLRPSGDPKIGLQLFVDINKDFKGVPPGVPKRYKGYTVNHRWIGIPRFASGVRPRSLAL